MQRGARNACTRDDPMVRTGTLFDSVLQIEKLKDMGNLRDRLPVDEP